MTPSLVVFFSPLIVVLAGALTVTGCCLQLAGRRYPVGGLAGAGMTLSGSLASVFLGVRTDWRVYAVLGIVLAVLALANVIRFAAVLNMPSGESSQRPGR